MSLIIHQPHLCTELKIKYPRYRHKTHDNDEWQVLLAEYKVRNASPVILITFTEAKHLAGQRFCIKREDAMRCPLDSNGKIPCYTVRMSQLQPWESAAEVRDIAFGLWD